MRPRHTVIALVAAALLNGCSAPVMFGGAVAGGAAVATDPRTTGTLIDDQGIEVKIASEIGENEPVINERAHIAPTSYNGIVLLTGEAPEKWMIERVSKIARSVPKVRHVYNEVIVAEPSSLGQRSRDTWLTTKVKSKLLADEQVDSSRLKVVTERDVVYLMGLTSRAQAERAATIARNTDGVKVVVKVIEYTD